MWIPVTKQKLEEHNKLWSLSSPLGKWYWDEADIIKKNATWLIARLYLPDAKIGAVIKPAFLQYLGLGELNKEAINWGDLNVDVQKHIVDGIEIWYIEIEEAAADSYMLCKYIRDWFIKWGWERVKVQTSW